MLTFDYAMPTVAVTTVEIGHCYCTHMLSLDHAMQNALGDAAKQDGTQGVVAIAKKAQDLYKQQQEIQKKADQRYGSSLDRLAGLAAQSTSHQALSC